MEKELIIKQEGDLTRLTLNRPETRNALNATLVEELISAVDEAVCEGSKLLVLSGNGKSFCAGFDLSDIKAISEAELIRRLIRIEILLQKVHHAPVAILAMAHGAAFGAGADLVVACGCRIASPNTRFRMPGLGFGVVLGTRRLANTVGSGAAREVLEGLKTIEAPHALKINLLTAIVAKSGWETVVDDELHTAKILSPSAKATMLREIIEDTRDRDLAVLVRSLTAPGLKARIAEFVQGEKGN